ncbi:uncharacterized protein JCM6883_001584 [Sporobolomyces salmoneus]|uniref:uncharacterized protein n=1 Tax=Sporobolomyces salmoneus TaxID=183962 RepID=UPI00317273A7
MSILEKLPEEVLKRIICYLDTPSDLATVSKRFSTLIRNYLSRDLVFRSSTAVQQYLKKNPKSPRIEGKYLTIAKGKRTRQKITKVGGRSKVLEWEDRVTEDELVELCRIHPHLVCLRIEEPAFSSLRRRQIGLLSNVSQLTNLSIIGRRYLDNDDSNGFNLTTIGQILQTVPQLKHLELRNIKSSKTSLVGIPPPTFKLSSLSLFTPSFLSFSQLSWLLSSTTEAESLRTLKFYLPPNVLPFQLHSVYWAPIRVTSLYISCENPAVIESMPLHFPHLERFTFALLRRPDRNRSYIEARRIFLNSKKYETLKELSDESKRGGMEPVLCMEGLMGFKPGLRKITLRGGRYRESGLCQLKEYCREMDIVFEERGCASHDW